MTHVCTRLIVVHTSWQIGIQANKVSRLYNDFMWLQNTE